MIAASGTELHWDSVGIEDKMGSLLAVVKSNEARTSRQNARLFGKLDRWRQQLETIIVAISRIHTALEPKLSSILGLRFEETELLSIAMFQPSTRNLFLELETHFTNESGPLGSDVFMNLKSLSDMARVLALVGDAAISMAVLHHLWRPRVADAGLLTQSRAELVSNDHLAWLCDEWGLYEHRIHFDPPTPTKSEISHTKGTLLEAVYGIVYIEHGLDEVKRLVYHLERHDDSAHGS
jgi:ribonuclease-3